MKETLNEMVVRIIKEEKSKDELKIINFISALQPNQSMTLNDFNRKFPRISKIAFNFAIYQLMDQKQISVSDRRSTVVSRSVDFQKLKSMLENGDTEITKL